MDGRALLFALLAAVGIGFVVVWFRNARAAGAAAWPTPVQLVIGAITDFFDTLGVGSFATTTSLYKLGKVVPDEKIPGTLNVGHTFPTLAQAFIFIAVVKVELATLALMIGAATAGAWLGAGFVSSWSRHRIRVGMGVLL